MEDITLTDINFVKNIELLKSLIKFILSKKKSIGKTEIVKICFLVDKYYAESIKSPEGFSTTIYVRYFYGPYSEAFPKALEQLEKEGWIKNEAESSILHKYQYRLLRQEKDEFDEIISQEIIQDIINKVLEETKDKSLNDIKKIAYSLKEVKEANFGEEIKLFLEEKDNNALTQMEF